MASKFYNEIKGMLNEGEVQNVYTKGLDMYFDHTPITRPYQCDGLIDTIHDGHKCKVLIEYKFDKNLRDAVERAGVLAQCVYYLKRFERDGQMLPNVCMVADVNECFVMHTNDLLSYLSFECDWTKAPSQAYKDTELVMAIAKNEAINPFVFEVNEEFSFKDVAERIKSFATNVQRRVNVTEHNISTIYNYFKKNVVKEGKKVNSNTQVSIFINAITDKDNCYLHPKKNNTIVCHGVEYPVSTKNYEAFFKYFNDLYSPSDKAYFARISDRLIDDEKRRNDGEFYTPTPFVDYAHKTITENLGEDWRDEYVVWDNCCGTKNLTRDYNFKELYCSTIEQGELDQCGQYNRNATSFVYDFLNAPLSELPAGLLNALRENKKIMFLINPPYATSGNWTNEKKTGCAKTKTNEVMLADQMGACSQNLYAQFLYRIMQIKEEYNLTNVAVGVFCPTLFLTGNSYEKFRNKWFKNFTYEKGFQFKASHFADVADNWGIGFTMWNAK